MKNLKQIKTSVQMNLKKKLTIMLFSTATYTSFAQFNIEQGIKYKWGCAVAINSIQAQIEIPLMTWADRVVVDADGNILAPGNRIDKSYSYSVVPKYHINNDMMLRLEFGITKLKSEADNDIKGYGVGAVHIISNTNVNSKIYRYSPGFQWTFMKTKKLETYCGITASYINYKSVMHNYYSEERDLVTDTIQSWLSQKGTTPGGFAIGIGALVGFNIYLCKRISFGAELSSSALYYKLGGEAIVEDTEGHPPNPVLTGTVPYDNSYKGFKISKIISSFNISVWF